MMDNLKEQAQFIAEYFPIANVQSSNDYIRVAMSIQAMIVALNLKDGDLIVGSRALVAVAGATTISRGMVYAGEMGITVSGTGKRTRVAEGGSQIARDNLFSQIEVVDIFCIVNRAKALGMKKANLLGLVGEKWDNMEESP